MVNCVPYKRCHLCAYKRLKEFGVSRKLGVKPILPRFYLPTVHWVGRAAGPDTTVARGKIMTVQGHEKPTAIHSEANQFTDWSRPSIGTFTKRHQFNGFRNTDRVPVDQAKLLEDLLQHNEMDLCDLRSLVFPLFIYSAMFFFWKSASVNRNTVSKTS